MPSHDPEYRGEPQSAPGEFGGEERIEYPLHRFGAHAAAVVTDLEKSVESGRHDTPQEDAGFRACAFDKGGSYLDLPEIVSYGLGGVDEHVHYNLLHLPAIGFDDTGFVAELEFNVDAPR